MKKEKGSRKEKEWKKEGWKKKEKKEKGKKEEIRLNKRGKDKVIKRKEGKIKEVKRKNGRGGRKKSGEWNENFFLICLAYIFLMVFLHFERIKLNWI